MLLLTLALAGPALAQPGEPGAPEGDRERLRQRVEERRGDGDQAPDQGRVGREDRGERGERERGGDGRPDRPSIRPEDVELALTVLAEFRPETAEELRELAKQDPQAAADRIARAFPRIRDFIQMKQDEPERFELHLRSMRAMREAWPLYREFFEAHRDGDEAKKAELRPKLREHVATMFDIRLEMRRLEIEQLRAQIQELERAVQELEDPARRDAAIDKKLEEDLNPDRWRGRSDGREGDERRDRDEREKPEE